ncbi:FAD-binding oxidoreductase [Candidatus Zixiibacteriota bacterium]
MDKIKQLATLVSEDCFSTQTDNLNLVSKDESTLEPVIPKAVIWPKNSDEICRIVKFCYENSITITTRGAGSALEGSTIPDAEGIVLDVSRMTKIIKLWPDDLMVKVEPGIIYDDLNNKIKNEGLFFPPSPGGSGDVATVGGMVSTNASGIYSVKYGATKDYVLALDVVTGTGESMTFGNRAIKRSSGYNLVDIISGSEGTLAVITGITLKLSGLPEGRLKTAYKFKTEVDAARAVSEMRKYGLDLAAIEFLDRHVMLALNKLKNYNLEEVPALFLEFHGPEEVLHANNELAASICEELDGEKLILEDGQNPWEIRHYVTDAIKYLKPGYTIIRNDVAFPISNLPEMVEYCHSMGNENKLIIHTFGHVGLGLLHALILADKENKTEWDSALQVNDKIIEKAIGLDGTISGEHGIGIGHKNLFISEHGKSVELMTKIKKQFDPHNILNPGKIFNS